MHKDKILNSFDSKNELAPNFWCGNSLKPKVRNRLLSVAHDFMDQSKIEWANLIDIVLTGSIANYTWSSYSDIDLHIIVDFSNMNIPEDLLWDYFSVKKDSWNKTHEDLFVYGFPVEIYVEDKNEYAGSTGVYSLLNDEWIKTPSNDKSEIAIDKSKIKRIAKKYIKAILFYKDRAYNSDDESVLLDTKEKLLRIFTILRTKRSEGLATSEKEMSFGNLLWKCIKRLGLIGELWKAVNHIYDKMNSINEVNCVNESFEFDDADEEDDEESFNRDMGALQEFARYNYYPETKEELQNLLLKLIEERGPEGDFNDIYTGDITDMSYLVSVEVDSIFAKFNGDISKWNVSKVENMRCMFVHCENFNQDLSGWKVGNVRDMASMFYGCTNFNQDLSGWKVGNVENMYEMFCGCKKFDQNISGWDVRNVKDMGFMFYGCEKFDQNIGGWDVRNVKDMYFMFCNCENFNQNIGGWDVRKVENMRYMFTHCENFNQDLSGWDVSNVEDMHEMFSGCKNFNQNLSGWNVSNVEDMRGMFSGCNSNCPIPSWYKETSVNESFEFDDADEEDDEESFDRDMSALHEFAQYNYFPKTKEELQEIIIKLIKERGFKGDFNDIYTGDITDMSYLFSSIFLNDEFNGDISNWNVSNVKDMSYMFFTCDKFNQNLSGWDVRKVENMGFMFNGCKKFDQNIGGWDVRNVKDMGFMFYGCENFNQDIGGWDVSKVKNMQSMFYGCKKFDQNLSGWNVSSVKDMRSIFRGCNSNCPIPSWYKKPINESFEFDDADEEDDEESFDRDMRALHEFARYNYYPETKEELREIIIKLIEERGPEGDFNDIYTGYITDMSDLFNAWKYSKSFEQFNGNISNWNVSKVEDMRNMFCGCENFNQDISCWDVSKVEDMSGMFFNCTNFNQNIGGWDVSNVRNMNDMFYWCTNFNQDISCWDVRNVTDKYGIFTGCENFNQDLIPKLKWIHK